MSSNVPSKYILPPHEAGVRIRVLAKGIQERLTIDNYVEPPFFPSSPDVELKWNQVNASMKALRTAIPHRRAAELRSLSEVLHEQLNSFRTYAYKDAREVAIKWHKRALTETRLSSGETLTRAAEEIWFLCQNLPTQPGLPSTDSRDVALRGIIAILRTHEIPGAEKLTHEAKEDQSATQEVKHGDEAASQVKAASEAIVPGVFVAADS